MLQGPGQTAQHQQQQQQQQQQKRFANYQHSGLDEMQSWPVLCCCVHPGMAGLKESIQQPEKPGQRGKRACLW